MSAKGYRNAHDDKDVRVIFLTGTGDEAFCAGGRPAEQRGGVRDGFRQPNVDYADLLRLSQNATKPAMPALAGSAWRAAWACCA